MSTTITEKEVKELIKGKFHAKVIYSFCAFCLYFFMKLLSLFKQNVSHSSKSEPCGLSQMIACRYGTVPIVRETGGLYDSIKPLENGYTFANFNAHDMLHVIREAVSDSCNNSSIIFVTRSSPL